MPDNDTPSRRFDMLSSSASGLTYVREKRGGNMRVLTESELADFNDPPPCPHCAEQFGCEHFNCAGEPILTEEEIEADAPPQWLAFAKECGISRPDLDRLQSIEEHEGEYRASAGADMRAQELALLLNESR
jgi:hypothetical protein